MSANYKVVARGNPAKREDPKKYYATYVSSERVTLRQLANQIGQISTVSSIDTLAVLKALLQVLPQQLADGKIVDLGKFGTFKLRIKSNGSDTPEGVNAKSITNVIPQFTPRKAFKQVIENTDFKKTTDG